MLHKDLCNSVPEHFRLIELLRQCGAWTPGSHMVGGSVGRGSHVVGTRSSREGSGSLRGAWPAGRTRWRVAGLGFGLRGHGPQAYGSILPWRLHPGPCPYPVQASNMHSVPPPSATTEASGAPGTFWETWWNGGCEVQALARVVWWAYSWVRVWTGPGWGLLWVGRGATGGAVLLQRGGAAALLLPPQSAQGRREETSPQGRVRGDKSRQGLVSPGPGDRQRPPGGGGPRLFSLSAPSSVPRTIRPPSVHPSVHPSLVSCLPPCLPRRACLPCRVSRRPAYPAAHVVLMLSCSCYMVLMLDSYTQLMP
jgi:hypothetical protein